MIEPERFRWWYERNLPYGQQVAGGVRNTLPLGDKSQGMVRMATWMEGVYGWGPQVEEGDDDD